MTILRGLGRFSIATHVQYMFRQFIRSASRVKLSLQEYRRQNVLKPDRESIKSRINSLYDVFEQDGTAEEPVVSKFRLNSPMAEIISKPDNLNPESVFKFIQNEIKHESLSFFKRQSTGKFDILFNVSSCTGRKAAAETIMKAFKDLVHNRRISVEGLRTKHTDWIVISLGDTKIHIFDAAKRKEVDLDSLLEQDEDVDFDMETFQQRLSSIVPKSIACKPALVEKYLKKRAAQ